jgi:hypothetical protein
MLNLLLRRYKSPTSGWRMWMMLARYPTSARAQTRGIAHWQRIIRRSATVVRVVRIAASRFAQPADRQRRSLHPNPHTGRARRVPTAASAESSSPWQTRRKRLRDRIGRQHVEAPARHDAGIAKLFDQLFGVVGST